MTTMGGNKGLATWRRCYTTGEQGKVNLYIYSTSVQVCLQCADFNYQYY